MRSAAMVFAAQEAVADAVVRKLEPRLLDCPARRGSRAAADNLRPEPLRAGALSPESRTDEGLHKALEFFEKRLSRIRSSRRHTADWPMPTVDGPLRRPSAGGRLGAGGVERGLGGDAGTATRRGHTSLSHMKATQDWTGTARRASSS